MSTPTVAVVLISDKEVARITMMDDIDAIIYLVGIPVLVITAVIVMSIGHAIYKFIRKFF